jgi:hypothetical protein
MTHFNWPSLPHEQQLIDLAVVVAVLAVPARVSELAGLAHIWRRRWERLVQALQEALLTYLIYLAVLLLGCAGALILSILFSPLMLLVALLIKLASPGDCANRAEAAGNMKELI